MANVLLSRHIAVHASDPGTSASGRSDLASNQANVNAGPVHADNGTVGYCTESQATQIKRNVAMQTMQDLILMHATRSTQIARLGAISQSLNRGVCYYHGAVKYGGHVLCCGGNTPEYSLERDLSAMFGAPLDGGLVWNARHKNTRNRFCDETEGLAFLSHATNKDTPWTAISFWDRSGDSRGNSNTTFIACGRLTFAQMIRLARYKWPQFWARFTFDVVQVDAQGNRVMESVP